MIIRAKRSSSLTIEAKNLVRASPPGHAAATTSAAHAAAVVAALRPWRTSRRAGTQVAGSTFEFATAKGLPTSPTVLSVGLLYNKYVLFPARSPEVKNNVGVHTGPGLGAVQ